MGALTILPAQMENDRFRQLLTMAPTVFPSTTREKIPRDFIYEAFKLAVAVQVDVAAGGGADGVLNPEQPECLLRELRILAGSSSRANVAELRKIDVPALRVFTAMLQHAFPVHVALAIPGIQAATQISSIMEIPFYIPRSEKPGVAALNCHELQSLDIELDWGNDVDLIAGGTRVQTLSNAIAQLSGAERLEDAANVRYAVNLMRYQEFTGVTANSRFPVEIKGTRLLRGLGIKQFTRAAGVNAHTPVNTIINSVTLEINGTPKLQWLTNGRANSGWALLQADNTEHYQIAIPTGYGLVDLMKKGGLAQLIRESDYTTVNLILDVNTIANGCLRIYPLEILDLAQ
jgi:hypothetical protein